MIIIHIHVPVDFQTAEVILLVVPWHQFIQDQIEEVVVEVATLQLSETTAVTSHAPIRDGLDVLCFVNMAITMHKCR